MRITELFTAQSIALDVAAPDQAAILDKLVDLQAIHGNITDKDAYKKALYAREAEASTYVDNGITVPHARTACVTRPSLAALRLSTPVQYNADDDGKTDLLFAIAAPENGSLHIDMLARMMQMLMNDDFVEKLRAAKTPAEFLDAIDAQGGITDSGVIYGQTFGALEYVTEDWFRQSKERYYTEEEMDNLIRLTERNEEGLLADRIQLSGMSDFALDHLTVLEGDLNKLREDGGRYVAAVYSGDDYGNAYMDSHWARLGDKVKIRYVEEVEYVDPDTGIAYASVEDVPAGANYVAQPVKYRDVEYEVAALVAVPISLSYRYYGADEFILNDQTFMQDSGTDSVMYYAFDTTDEANSAMEEFLRDYTENVNPQFDYESKALYASEFEGMRSMFQLCGGALSFIVGLVGVLNFFNAILTGIIARKREFAVLQSIGMAGKQLKTMLVYEGLLYALGAAGISLVLTLIFGPVAFKAVGSLFWFFTYRLTLTPFLIVAPVFALLGVLVPLAVYRSVSKATIVERLREVD